MRKIHAINVTQHLSQSCIQPVTSVIDDIIVLAICVGFPRSESALLRSSLDASLRPAAPPALAAPPTLCAAVAARRVCKTEWQQLTYMLGIRASTALRTCELRSFVDPGGTCKTIYESAGQGRVSILTLAMVDKAVRARD